MTLERDNLVWLRGVAARGKRKSLSDALDDILTTARLTGAADGSVRSVVGTVDIAPDDRDLTGADKYIQTLFATSISKPLAARERQAKFGSTKRTRHRG